MMVGCGDRKNTRQEVCALFKGKKGKRASDTIMCNINCNFFFKPDVFKIKLKVVNPNLQLVEMLP